MGFLNSTMKSRYLRKVKKKRVKEEHKRKTVIKIGIKIGTMS
jgi:hypothetical protein